MFAVLVISPIITNIFVILVIILAVGGKAKGAPENAKASTPQTVESYTRAELSHTCFWEQLVAQELNLSLITLIFFFLSHTLCCLHMILNFQILNQT